MSSRAPIARQNHKPSTSERDFVLDSLPGEHIDSFFKRTGKKASGGVEVVGTKTHAALESDWLKDFQSSNPHGRPEGTGWLTPNEMAEQAGVEAQVIRRYLSKNKDKYEQAKGTIKLDVGARAVTFFRLAQTRTVSPLPRSSR
jgi:hypothetical protein